MNIQLLLTNVLLAALIWRITGDASLFGWLFLAALMFALADYLISDMRQMLKNYRYDQSRHNRYIK